MGCWLSFRQPVVWWRCSMFRWISRIPFWKCWSSGRILVPTSLLGLTVAVGCVLYQLVVLSRQRIAGSLFFRALVVWSPCRAFWVVSWAILVWGWRVVAMILLLVSLHVSLAILYRAFHSVSVCSFPSRTFLVVLLLHQLDSCYLGGFGRASCAWCCRMLSAGLWNMRVPFRCLASVFRWVAPSQKLGLCMSDIFWILLGLVIGFCFARCAVIVSRISVCLLSLSRRLWVILVSAAWGFWFLVCP